MMDRAAIRATGGSWSRPVVHLGFNLIRACSHQAGVVFARESMEEGGEGKEEEEGEAEADMGQLNLQKQSGCLEC